MNNQIDEYLNTLRKELAGSDPAIIQDALSDAEEHLRTALANIQRAQPDVSEADILLTIIEDFGTPE